MDEAVKSKLLLVGDLFGSLLFVVGALGQFGGEGSYAPESLQFPGHNLVFITVGIALIVPYMVHVIKRGAAKQKQQ